MTKDQVKIGGLYLCKVSGKVVTVKITSHAVGFDCGGWFGVNMDTGRQVCIRSARRLRGVVRPNRGERLETIISEPKTEAKA